MRIGNTYSSWTRNRLTPELRATIAAAGEGRVDFRSAIGRPLKWVGCTITAPEGTANGEGPDPAAAFHAAAVELAVVIVSVLDVPA